MEVRKWEDLEAYCLVKIFEKLETPDLLSTIPLVCKPWFTASLHPQCWKSLDLRNITRNTQMKLAVDRSCGIAEDIFFPREFSLEEFIYISERCPAAKIVNFPRMPIPQPFPPNSKDVIPQLVGKWKELEFLSLNVGFYFAAIISQVSVNCKNFKELMVNGYVKSEHASAIVTWLPSIKSIKFGWSSNIPRELLLFILAGCQKLEKVDIRCCYGFDPTDEEILKKSSHIKVFDAQGSKLRNKFLQLII